jgi:RNA polymerase sigma-70 factor (ECF subfamily)
MAEEPTFRELIDRVRAGDQRAAAELVQRYEPAIRVAVRVRLTDRRLRQRLDSMDICQSVWGSFFVRAAAGQFELDQEQQLLRLLTTMVRNKVVNQAARDKAARRGGGRTHAEATESGLVAPGPSPSEAVANEDLLRRVRERLTDEEQRLADWRASGDSWEQIAARGGKSPDAARMQLTRALDRVTSELRLEE